MPEVVLSVALLPVLHRSLRIKMLIIFHFILSAAQKEKKKRKKKILWITAVLRPLSSHKCVDGLDHNDFLGQVIPVSECDGSPQE